MKGFTVLVGVALIVAAHCVSVEDVRKAIEDLKKGDENHEGKPKKGTSSPMKNFHAQMAHYDKSNAAKANAILNVVEKLMQNGVTLEELQEEEVMDDLVDCPPDPICVPGNPYRTADGSCNNPYHPYWGMAGTTQLRLIGKHAYEGASLPRTKGKDGTPLRNPRTISNKVHAGKPGVNENSKRLTLLFVIFGQFLDHDLTLTPVIEADCCDSEMKYDPNQCFPLIVEDDDDDTFPAGYCMNFPRSVASLCPPSPGGPYRNQLNGITAFVDASNVYGSSKEEQYMLRNKEHRGFLKTSEGDKGQERLPINEDPTSCMADKENGYLCGKAGDERVNENPLLHLFHTLFVREHNRIAETLEKCFPDEEELFQVARKIVGAEIQMITYKEFLPALLSEDVMNQYHLRIDDHHYDRSVNAGISLPFSTAAFRFGHSLVADDILRCKNKICNIFDAFPLEDHFFKTELTYGSLGMDRLADGMAAAEAAKSDRKLVEALRSQLFVNGDEAFDLAALNIQRGRDHGLPPYNEFREFCHLPRAMGWYNTERGLVDHTTDNVELLQMVYNHVDDIDLFTGGLSEIPVPGGTVGPTFACLIADQFDRLKRGDYHWYTGSVANFTQDQLDTINGYSLAKLLCNNMDILQINYPNAFLLGDPVTKCKDIKGNLDLELFKPPNCPKKFVP